MTLHQAALDKLTQRKSELISIFVLHFGEENVDVKESGGGLLRHCGSEELGVFNEECIERECISSYNTDYNLKIIVRTPEVTVTNEKGFTHPIYDVYTCHAFDALGRLKGRFTLNRGTYSIGEVNAGYKHSHAMKAQAKSEFITNSTVCLGTSPLNTLTLNMNSEYDYDQVSTYCILVDQWLQIESLIGIPYVEMQGCYNGTFEKIPYLVPLIKIRSSEVHTAAVKYCLLKLDITHMRSDNFQLIIEPFWEFSMKLGEILEEGGFRALTHEGILRDGVLNRVSRTIQDGSLLADELDGEVIGSFKGEDIRIKILPNNEENIPNDIVRIAKKDFASYMYTFITVILNHEFEVVF